MSKTKATATKAKSTKTTKGAPQIKKDGKGRFWLVPKDGSAEQGPFETKQAALSAKAGDPAPKAEKTTKAAKAKKAKEPKEKRVSALDAAAQVVSASKEPMNAKEMIEAMAAKKLWTSPGGKTPHATLFSALIREIAAKGKDARFVKTERGKFAAK
ncbi:MAG TPA: HTH domain-containing protein [bacterium]|nr:HTH domain-containing protein [bacterium]